MSSSTVLGLGLSCIWIVYTLLYVGLLALIPKPIFINVNENGLSLELLSKYISYSTETCECKDINKKQILYNIIIGIMPSGDSTNIVRFDMNGNTLFVMHQRQRVFQMSLKPDSMNKLRNNQIGFQWIPPYFKIYFPGFMIFDIHIDQLQISDNLKHKLKTGDVLPIISGGPGCKSMEVVAIGPDVLRHMSSQDPHNYRQIPSAHVQSVSSGIQKRTQHADPNHPTTSIYPSYWSRQHVVRYGEAKVFDLPLDGSEAQNVLRRFYENSPRDKYQVVRMEFIQNQLLYEKYNQERRILDKLGEDKREILFHGTGKPYHQTNSGLKPDCNKVMKAIAQQGFRKEFSTQAHYGQGSYFAKKSSYVLDNNFADCDTKTGYKILLGCYVAIGKIKKGERAHILTNWPVMDSGLIYDALVDNEQQPTIYVIHENARAYPAFIIYVKQNY